MKISHVIPSFFPDNVAGTEVYCLNLCKQLIREGMDTEVIIPGFGAHATTEYLFEGIRVIRYAEPTVQSRLHISGLAMPSGIHHFREYLKKSMPDCVHFHGIYPGIGITIQHLAEVKALRIPVIYTMHISGHICITQTLIHDQKEPCDGIIRPFRCASCNLVHQKNGKPLSSVLAGLSYVFEKSGIDPGAWDNRLGTALSVVNRIDNLKDNLSRIAKYCDQVVVLAKWFGQKLTANGFPAGKIEYMPPGIVFGSTVKSNPVSVPFNHPDSVKLLFVGRIDPIKDLKILLTAFTALPTAQYELSVYGNYSDAAYYEECRELAAHHPDIHWRGVFNRDQTLQIFERHHILCLPSALSEMSPLVIQEAFGAGIPVLASDVLGNAELVHHNQNGLLFAYKSGSSLLGELKRLTEEEGLLTLLKNGVRPPLPFEEIGDRYIAIYTNNSRSLKQKTSV